jgi:uncharacterized membrane protein
MPEPVDPISPPPTPIPEVEPSSTGLPSNVAAALACIPLVGGIIFWILEKRDSFVRYYAMQSIIFGGAWLLFNIVWKVITLILIAIPAIGWLFALLLGLLGALCQLAFLVIFIIAVIKAFTGVRWDIPYVGPVARKQGDSAI